MNQSPNTNSAQLSYRPEQNVETKVTFSQKMQGFFKHTHRTITLLGVFALMTLGIIFFKPDIGEQLLALSPFDEDEAGEIATLSVEQDRLTTLYTSSDNTDANTASVVNDPITLSQQQTRVVKWLSKRYRVSEGAIEMMASTAYAVGQDLKLDPLLILAVISIESRFNPFAESPMGAKGLMQVMSDIHHAKFADFGGVQAALNPVANIQVGASILKEYITRTGSISSGLRKYVGASAMETEGGYGIKVLSEFMHLKSVASGKSISIYTKQMIKNPYVALTHLDHHIDTSDAKLIVSNDKDSPL